MAKVKDISRPVGIAGAVLFVIGLILLLAGFAKSAEFKKTEKIKMTFTEPVVSVSEGRDADDNKEYTMHVKYVYNGEERSYIFTRRDRIKVGEMVTFTKYFAPDGTELENDGNPLFAGGGVAMGLSLPGMVVLISETVKKRKQKNAIETDATGSI